MREDFNKLKKVFEDIVGIYRTNIDTYSEQMSEMERSILDMILESGDKLIQSFTDFQSKFENTHMSKEKYDALSALYRQINQFQRSAGIYIFDENNAKRDIKRYKKDAQKYLEKKDYQNFVQFDSMAKAQELFIPYLNNVELKKAEYCRKMKQNKVEFSNLNSYYIASISNTVDAIINQYSKILLSKDALDRYYPERKDMSKAELNSLEKRLKEAPAKKTNAIASAISNNKRLSTILGEDKSRFEEICKSAEKLLDKYMSFKESLAQLNVPGHEFTPEELFKVSSDFKELCDSDSNFAEIEIPFTKEEARTLKMYRDNLAKDPKDGAYVPVDMSDANNFRMALASFMNVRLGINKLQMSLAEDLLPAVTANLDEYNPAALVIEEEKPAEIPAEQNPQEEIKQEVPIEQNPQEEIKEEQNKEEIKEEQKPQENPQEEIKQEEKKAEIVEEQNLQDEPKKEEIPLEQKPQEEIKQAEKQEEPKNEENRLVRYTNIMDKFEQNASAGEIDVEEFAKGINPENLFKPDFSKAPNDNIITEVEISKDFMKEIFNPENTEEQTVETVEQEEIKEEQNKEENIEEQNLQDEPKKEEIPLEQKPQEEIKQEIPANEEHKNDLEMEMPQGEPENSFINIFKEETDNNLDISNEEEPEIVEKEVTKDDIPAVCEKILEEFWKKSRDVLKHGYMHSILYDYIYGNVFYFEQYFSLYKELNDPDLTFENAAKDVISEICNIYKNPDLNQKFKDDFAKKYFKPDFIDKYQQLIEETFFNMTMEKAHHKLDTFPNKEEYEKQAKEQLQSYIEEKQKLKAKMDDQNPDEEIEEEEIKEEQNKEVNTEKKNEENNEPLSEEEIQSQLDILYSQISDETYVEEKKEVKDPNGIVLNEEEQKEFDEIERELNDNEKAERDIEKYKNALSSLYNALESTNSFFSRDSDQFKNLMSYMRNIDYNNLQPESMKETLDQIRDLAAAYKIHTKLKPIDNARRHNREDIANKLLCVVEDYKENGIKKYTDALIERDNCYAVIKDEVKKKAPKMTVLRENIAKLMFMNMIGSSSHSKGKLESYDPAETRAWTDKILQTDTIKELSKPQKIKALLDDYEANKGLFATGTEKAFSDALLKEKNIDKKFADQKVYNEPDLVEGNDDLGEIIKNEGNPENIINI